MTRVWQTLYAFLLLPLLLTVVRVAALKNAKVRATLDGHRGLWQRVASQLAERQNERPLVWFHVASAGEYLQAMPVMERLMGAGLQCALTVTSVSGYQWAMKRRNQYHDLVMVDYLPFDTRANMGRMLALLKPAALVHVKFDLWPNLIWETQRRGIPQFLISATLHERSKRVTSALGRSLYRGIYACLDGIYAVSKADRQRFLATCPGHASVLHVGDTRFDSVLDRRRSIQPPQLPGFVQHNRVLILGSTWPADEAQVLPVARQALEDFHDLVCVVVPHEVDAAHLQAIENAFTGLPLSRFTSLSPHSSEAFRVVLVDTVGQLSSLYHYADIAYVGGAFGRGVHNVMEPSAMGVPTVFGPFFQNSPEAIALLNQQKCFSIDGGEKFREILYQLLGDPEECRQLGAQAAAYIEDQAGAADRCFELIRKSLP